MNVARQRQEIFEGDVVLVELQKHWYILECVGEIIDSSRLIIVDTCGGWHLSDVCVFPFFDCDYLEFLEANVVERL